MSEVGTAIYADWDKLSLSQHVDVKLLREKISTLFIAETEAFYKVHPELRIDWQFTLRADIWEAKVRVNHE